MRVKFKNSKYFKSQDAGGFKVAITLVDFQSIEAQHKTVSIYIHIYIYIYIYTHTQDCVHDHGLPHTLEHQITQFIIATHSCGRLDPHTLEHQIRQFIIATLSCGRQK